ncbi:CRISPR-associated protein [Sinosporangium album]|uniref:CRISPR-associated protein n=1 Tax=Sinosporangium album TaxID=504805 RepID=A0A1G7VRD7_9ACTN|nr:TIGR03986 family CRISPR-associated RAMP protein [Sinosporangium album]SDG62313.1 CRISPR-associated protein [Sinosporangium album]
MGAFLNPYTFIPAYPRPVGSLPKDLADGPPPPRDRLREDCWTGTIGVTLTVETPLLLLDTARATPPSTGEDGHWVYPVRLRGGKPHLPSTSVKGMLRAAYEAITNSRFGVFEPHDRPYGFRRSAGFALDLVPVDVSRKRVIRRYRTAVLKMYDEDGRNIFLEKHGWTPRHNEFVAALITRSKPAKVIAIQKIDSPDSLVAGEEHIVVRGSMCINGPTIEGKTSERLFYVEPRTAPEELRLAKPWYEIESDWNLLIDDYRAAHDKAELFERTGPDGRPAGPGERIGKGPGQMAWSPHLYDERRMDLANGMLCYALLNKRNEVERLFPVLVPRDLYPVTPASLLGANLEPAPSYDRLSPADRVFGWVAPQGSGVRPAAYKGRVRIGPVTCPGGGDAVRRFDGDGLPIAILGQPKPQQGRFYAAASADRPEQPIPDGTAKEKLYRKGHGLRGRKAYWHHAGLDSVGHWRIPRTGEDPAQLMVGGRYREHLRSRAVIDPDKDPKLIKENRRFATGLDEQRDTQNRSIGGWVNPGTTFHFTIEVRDLDDHELGALAWLLSLPEGHFHRLGLGRPLGFGSVRLDVDPERTELHSGRQYAAYYSTLSADLPRQDGAEALAAARAVFERRVEGIPHVARVRDSVLAVAAGKPESPVHYPRTRPPELNPAVAVPPPDPRGRNFEWFTENERIDGGKVKGGRGRSLPTVTEGVPLQTYVKEDKEEKDRQPNRGRGRKGGKPKWSR